MKNIIKTAKAIYTLLTSGWYTLEYHGSPKEMNGRYIVCLSNNAVVELHHANIDELEYWFRLRGADFLDENPIMFWRYFPNPPHKHLKKH